MLARLIENWLDNASELSYQAPFCQLLLGRGHRVLHSTQHTPLESGKDVISVDPSGVYHAYQLKGNPGGHLTVTDLRRIDSQLQELVLTPIRHPDARGKPHRSHLVTNGEVNEQAEQRIADFNAGLLNRGLQGPGLELIRRGDLMNWSLTLGADLWPSELTELGVLIELLGKDGSEPPSQELISQLLSPVLFLEPDKLPVPKATVLRRAASAAGVLLAVALQKFERRENHATIMASWIQYATYLIATAERSEFSSRHVVPSLEIAVGEILRRLHLLCKELDHRPDGIEGDSLCDWPFYRARLTLLRALMAVYWLWEEEKGWVHEDDKDMVERFLESEVSPHIWGEGAIPQVLAYIWYVNRSTPGALADMMLRGVADGLISRTSRHHEGLPSPYLSVEEVVGYQLRKAFGQTFQDTPLRTYFPGEYFPSEDQRIARDACPGTSFMAEGLFVLLARRNLKQACKALWRQYSKILRREYVPASAWEFCLWKAESGHEKHTVGPKTVEWQTLRKTRGDPIIPSDLLERPYLLLLFLVFAPHRVRPAVLEALDGRLT